RIQLQHLWLEHLLAAEGEQLSGQRAGLLCGPIDFVEMFPLPVEEHRGPQDVNVAANDGKEVVEVVCYAPGQLADCFHFLSLPKLLLELGALRLLELVFLGELKNYPRGDRKLTDEIDVNEEEHRLQARRLRCERGCCSQ